ncbi:oxidative stress transcription coactivator/ribosome recycling protein Oxs1 [Schizosaccharomyces pombe]|uniref:Coiled-coil domain-containing protein 124 homolog n=1 Tax=Schizosaccharomyces pombe (strain 972 / ATCC 24843) TaxID=284812 RepID=CC124_SCHPO|nr:HMG-box variant [Schizosaccharomyces pombe]O94389.1 RecName: Full=Coiled-coil domain-containing protein 124 homolog [Schizosaccharomyces pombe 972h-]CAA22440.1 HMG-box variant [Schizosaccharomyces pombe]|eukprot:NP_596057.1 HMG-box variant [Schizosaccharomyces pombe]
MGNPKKRAEKAEAAKSRKQDEEKKKKDAEEDEKWSKGVKTNKKEQEAEKRKAALERKAERERLEKEEMESLPSKGGKGSKKAAKKNSSLDAFLNETPQTASYSARNIDDALDLLSLNNSSSKDKIDRHPERRFKAALTEYKQSRLPELRKEQPGLRLNQYEDIMYKEFQKHPDNPFNKMNVSYNTSQDEVEQLRKARKAELEARLRE